MKAITGAAVGLALAIAIISAVSINLTRGSGRLVVLVTDPPEWQGATNVYINYSEIMIHRADAGDESGWETVAAGGTINLTSVLNVTEAVGETSLRAGLYNLIRFNVTGALVTIENETTTENYTATVASGMLNVPITKGGVRVEAGDTTYVLIDINSRVEGSASSGLRLVPAARAEPHSPD